jgi:hypothetical protein
MAAVSHYVVSAGSLLLLCDVTVVTKISVLHHSLAKGVFAEFFLATAISAGFPILAFSRCVTILLLPNV